MQSAASLSASSSSASASSLSGPSSSESAPSRHACLLRRRYGEEPRVHRLRVNCHRPRRRAVQRCLILDSRRLSRGPPPTTAAVADPPPMSHAGVVRQPRMCAAAALPGVTPHPTAAATFCEQCIPLRDASAAWAGGCRGRFDTWVSLPAAAAADNGAATVN